MPKPEKPADPAGDGFAVDEPVLDGGDRVQLVRTGWVRFVIAGHGRVRFRPARFGELLKIVRAQEAMFEEIDDRAQGLQIANAQMQDTQAEVDADTALSEAERTEAMLALVRENRRMTRKFTRDAEADRVGWWRTVHEILGQPGETLPGDDDLPVWLLEPSLMTVVIKHWRTVPLDPGRK